MKTLDELFTEEEERALAQQRAEIAREAEAWASLPQAERDRILAEAEARLAAGAEAEGDDEDMGGAP